MANLKKTNTNFNLSGLNPAFFVYYNLVLVRCGLNAG